MKEELHATDYLKTSVVILIIVFGISSSFSVGSMNVSAQSVLSLDGSAQNNLYGVTSVTINLTTSNYPDVIYVIASAPVSGQFGISDSSNLVWTERTEATYGGSSPISLEAWYAIANSPLASDSITVTAPSSTNLHVIGWGISGANTASPFDSSVPVQSSGSSYTASVSITTTNSNDLILGSIAQRGTSSATTASGFSAVVSPSGYPLADAEYQVATTPQSVSASFSLTKNYNWVMIGDAIVSASSSTA